MKKVKLSDILDMTFDERIRLVQDIWDSIAVFPEKLELTKEQREELERRLEVCHLDPEAGSPWEEIKAGILKS